MNNISNVNGHVQANKVQLPHSEKTIPGGTATSEAPAPSAVDRAEFSELSQLLSIARDLPDVRDEKVADIRAAIEKDEQEFVQQRLSQAVTRLLKDLL